MAKNSNLHDAKRRKKDEFYTRIEDISDQLYHYREHFHDKKVFHNCDDPTTSDFWKYFELNFEDLGLRKLTATHYDPEERTYKLVMEAGPDGKPTTTQTPLEGNGDFRSAECIELLDEADIITTNPPFSLFREYVAQLMEHDKKFVIIGPQNAITYKEIFPLLMGNQIWLGYPFRRGDAYFRVPKENADNYAKGVYDPTTGMVHFRNCHWFTNLDIDKRHQPITLWRDYYPEDYPRYDNYDAIEVNRLNDIPCDYFGLMGVPITFMDKYCPEQFVILGMTDRDNRYGLTTRIYTAEDTPKYGDCNRRGAIRQPDGSLKSTYARILIQRADRPKE